MTCDSQKNEKLKKKKDYSTLKKKVWVVQQGD